MAQTELLTLKRTEGTSINEWRGRPMLVPLRRSRKHVGFVWYFVNLAGSVLDDDRQSLATLATALMETIEERVLGQVITYGRTWDCHT